MPNNISAVSLPKATLRSGLNYINTKAKSINVEDTSDTGVEAAKMMYKTASEGRQLATSVKSGIKTSAKVAKNTYRVAREIPGKVRTIPKTARKVATAVKTAPNTAKKAVTTSAKKAAQNAKKMAKQAQKAAKRTAEATKKAAQAAEKVAEVTFKAMAKAAAFFVTHLPIILIVSLVLIVVFLIVALASGMITVVSNTTVGGISYAIPGDENSKPEEIAEILDNYQNVIDNGMDQVKEQYISKANSFLTEDDDFYDAITANRRGYWITYAGGEPTVREILDTVEIDYAEFYALLYVYMQKERNVADGDGANDIYSFTFTDADLIDFLYKYFDISYNEASGLDCPGQNCHIRFCEGCKTGSTTVSTPEGPKTVTYKYCPGHPYCDHEHKKATISITKNTNVMDDLGFTDGEKQWKDLIEQLYSEYIMGYILNGGSTS